MTKIRILLLAAVLVIAGCTVTRTFEDPPGSGNTKTEHVVDPKLAGGLEAAKAINDASAPFSPFAGLIGIAIGAVGAGATWFAKYKNTRDQLHATIIGVEQKGGEDVKAAIRDAAMAAGVESSLGKVVQKVTGG